MLISVYQSLPGSVPVPRCHAGPSAGVPRGAAAGRVGRARGRTALARAEGGEECVWTGVCDHGRGGRARSPVRAGVRAPPCHARALGHQQHQQPGDRRDGPRDLQRDGHTHRG